MTPQTLEIKSLRFFPEWDHDNIYQLVGLIRMVDFILSENPNAERWMEIGSFIGESSSVFLSFDKIKRLDCVDIWLMSEQKLKKKFQREIEKSRCFVHRRDSSEFANDIQDASVDVVYIDGDHSYVKVNSDIVSYYPKLKAGGYLCGHDYHKGYPGVIKAVDDFAAEKKKSIKIFDDTSWVILP